LTGERNLENRNGGGGKGGTKNACLLISLEGTIPFSNNRKRKLGPLGSSFEAPAKNMPLGAPHKLIAEKERVRV